MLVRRGQVGGTNVIVGALIAYVEAVSEVREESCDILLISVVYKYRAKRRGY